MSRRREPDLDAAARPRRTRRLRARTVFLVLLSALAAVRIALPAGLRLYVEDVLDRAEDYGGWLADLDVNLWQGAYELEGLSIDKVEGGASTPLFEARRMQLAIDWSKLRNGRLVGEVDLSRPVLQVLRAPDPTREETGVGRSWQDRLDELFPFRIERMTVRAGSVRYRDLHADPPIDLWFDDVWGEASSLGAAVDPGESPIATFQMAARPFDEGRLAARLELDQSAEQPRFDLDLAATRIPLRRLNDVLLAFAGVDAEGGTLSLWLEVSAENGRLDGYAKLLVEDVDLFRFAELTDPDQALGAVWDALVGGAAEVLENQPYDRLATRVDLSGSLEDIDADVWQTVRSLLANAFLDALLPGLGGEHDEITAGGAGADGDGAAANGGGAR